MPRPGLREWRDALHLGTRPSPDRAAVEGCHATSIIDFLPLPELIGEFGELGCDVVEMVLASQDSWDRYAAAQWLNIRRWLDDNPGDELAGEMRAELAGAPARYARYQREYLGWGVFALMNRLSGPIGCGTLSRTRPPPTARQPRKGRFKQRCDYGTVAILLSVWTNPARRSGVEDGKSFGS